MNNRNSLVEQAAADQLALSGVGRGVDPREAAKLGHELPEWMISEYIGAPAVEANIEVIDEDRFRGADAEVTPEEAAEMSKEHRTRCGHGNILGSCERCRLGAES